MRLFRLAAAALAGCALAGAAAAQPAAAPAPSQSAAPPPTAGTPAGPPAGAYRPITPAGDILATLQASGQFTTFVKAINATNLTQIMKAQPNITVFAPTDAAFAAQPELQSLFQKASIPQLQKLVTYHLVNARLDSSQIKGHAATPVPTVAAAPVTIDGSNDPIKVNDANVVQADVMASNGVIHVVDKVLSPSAAPSQASAAAGPAAPAG